MKNYAAVAKKDGTYAVAYIGPCLGIHYLNDIRTFKTYEEAVMVAQKIAKGEYGYASGNYVSMR